MNQSFEPSRVRGIRASPLVAAAAIGSFLVLSACASTPEPPTRELQAAESAIASAEQDRVATYASAELREARDKLSAARTAVRDEEMVRARYLAEESRVHAQLAAAQAEEIKAKAVNDDMQKSIDTLKQEMQRSSGARQ
ncbi:MAG TPA: DUF4398 domain-containing protein [Woeseiaceae bacterium]